MYILVATVIISRPLLLTMAVLTQAAATATPALSTMPAHEFFSSLSSPVPSSTTPLGTTNSSTISLESASITSRSSPVLLGSTATMAVTHVATSAKSEVDISPTAQLDSTGSPIPSSEVTSPMVPSLATRTTTLVRGADRSLGVRMQTTVVSRAEDTPSASPRTRIQFSTSTMSSGGSSPVISAIAATSTHTPIRVVSMTPRPSHPPSSISVTPHSSNEQISTDSNESDGGGLSTVAIAGIAAGGAAVVITGLVIAVLVVLCLVLRARKRKAFKTKPKKKRKLVDKSDSFVLHRMNRQVFAASGGGQ